MLKIHGLSRNFGGLMALERVDLHVPPGEIVGLIGPNGSGKTTLFNVVTGFLAALKGQVFFDETDITHRPTHEIIRLGIARTFQNVRVFKRMTVYENVWAGQHQLTRSGLMSLFPAGRDAEKRLRGQAEEILELMGLEDRRETIAGNLPFGLQRRLEVARALATEPKLLLLDEPASGISGQEVESLMASIKKINATGKTILIIEHDMKVIMNLSKRIAVLNFGRKIAEGPPEAVRSSPAVVEAYLGTKGEPGA